MTAVGETSGAARNRVGHAWQVRLLAAVIFLVAGLMIVEVGLRLYSILAGRSGAQLAARDPLRTIYEPFGHAGYRPKPRGVEVFRNGSRAHYNSMAYRGPLVAIPKPAGVYRIVLLGGSTTVGYDVNDDETIDSYMRSYLAERFPGRCFEVVNLGLGGYDSYQDYERLRNDGIPLAPDLVIIHSGINDVRNALYDSLSAPPDPRTLIWEAEMQRIRSSSGLDHLWTMSKHYLYLARFPGYLAEILHQRATLDTLQVVEPHDDAIRYFDINLTRTVDLSLRAGAAVILSKPPSALRTRNQPTDPVEKSYWIKDAATTEQYRDRLGARMEEIAKRYQKQGRSVAYLTHTLTLDQYLDDAHLAPSGNQTVAGDFTAALSPLISTSTGGGACRAP